MLAYSYAKQMSILVFSDISELLRSSYSQLRVVLNPFLFRNKSLFVSGDEAWVCCMRVQSRSRAAVYLWPIIDILLVYWQLLVSCHKHKCFYNKDRRLYNKKRTNVYNGTPMQYLVSMARKALDPRRTVELDLECSYKTSAGRRHWPDPLEIDDTTAVVWLKSAWVVPSGDSQFFTMLLLQKEVFFWKVMG